MERANKSRCRGKFSYVQKNVGKNDGISGNIFVCPEQFCANFPQFFGKSINY
jgi:hypothetical protein